jgi:hypothetical protein
MVMVFAIREKLLAFSGIESRLFGHMALSLVGVSTAPSGDLSPGVIFYLSFEVGEKILRKVDPIALHILAPLSSHLSLYEVQIEHRSSMGTNCMIILCLLRNPKFRYRIHKSVASRKLRDAS